ncbi:SRPBCC family protein [Neobacillus notoginsengisoli]|uniref:SRPBCC family protein n=1 Tax=Neobacillus notoginsengisoli TaxID=1578198 RepID=A0A417Z102_9BACI|nr:SRPBCC family protein [Neobacillus notoginsengisoli]RHW43521.1 SRPBCC family protein [Neobacillus notoginsengisoli]
MPRGVYSIDLKVPIEKVWRFVGSIDNWAPLVPGYIEHKIISDKESTWAFKGDFGFMKKTIKLKVDITEWNEPVLVTFDLTGLSDNFAGNGYFKAEKRNGSSTRMTGCLDITAYGIKGPVANSILKNFVPETTEELTTAVAKKILEIENASLI